MVSVAPEPVWQVWRPPYQSEIWYGGEIGMAAPYQSAEMWAVDFQKNH